MMASFKSRSSMCGVFSLFLLSTVVASANQQQADGTPQARRFVFLTREAADEFGLAVQEIRGSITWLSKDEVSSVLHLDFAEIDRTFEKPESMHPALDIKPFLAKASFSRDREVPLEIDILRGRLEEESLGLGVQFRIVYLILEMMFLTADTQDLVVSRNDSQHCPVSLVVTWPDNVGVAGFGDLRTVSRQSLRTSISPSRFSAFPRIDNGMRKGWDFVSLAYDSRNIRYFSRFRDEQADMVIHAVNIRASTKQEMTSEDYSDMLNAIADPDRFSSYNSYELTLTSARD